LEIPTKALPNYAVRHGYGTRDFNTYSRGRTCIDYVLMDGALAEAVRKCGYLPLNNTILSDHR
jgi:hypothetical protein